MVSAPTPKPSINPKAIATSVITVLIFVVGLIFSFAQEYFAYMRLHHSLWKADNFLIKCSLQSLSREGCLSCRTCSGRGRLSEIRRRWKFGLTPFPRLRSKANAVIREILLYSWAQFAFNLIYFKFNLPASFVYIQNCSPHVGRGVSPNVQPRRVSLRLCVCTNYIRQGFFPHKTFFSLFFFYLRYI